MKVQKSIIFMAITGLMLTAIFSTCCWAKQPAKKQKKQTLTVGTTLDLSRGAKNLGQNILKTLQLVFDRANKENLIPGLYLDLLYYDDQYMASKAYQNVKEMIEKGVDILLCPIGGSACEAYLDLVKTQKVLLLFPQGPVPISNITELKCCVTFGPTYGDQAREITNYVIKHMRPKKVVIVYQDDAPGNQILEESIKIMNQAKIPCFSLPFERNELNFVDQIKKLKKINPDCIGLVGAPYAVKKFILRFGNPLKKKFFVPALESTDLEDYMNKQKMKFVASNVIPPPQKGICQIVDEYLDIAQKNNINHDWAGLSSYICTSIFIDTLKKAKAPTKEKIIRAFQDIINYNFKGLNLYFDPKHRRLSNLVWLYTLNGKWEQITIDQ